MLTCPRCSQQNSDDAPRCTNCRFEFWPPALASRQVTTYPGHQEAINNTQPYRYGWIFACTSLVGADPSAPGLGLGLGVFVAAWSAALGLAAASVRPWGWYVLLVSWPLGLAYASFYLFFIATFPLWHKIIFLFLAVVFYSLSTAYFYKRRAMFGAKWRWKNVERRWPQLIGPDVHTGATRGFRGLSWWRRLLFIAVIVTVLVGARLGSRDSEELGTARPGRGDNPGGTCPWGTYYKTGFGCTKIGE